MSSLSDPRNTIPQQVLCVASHIKHRFFSDQGMRLRAIHPVRQRDNRTDKRQKRLEKIVLADELHRTGRPYAFGEVRTRIDRNARNECARPVLQNVTCEIESVGIGEVDVHQDKSRAMPLDMFQGSGAIWRFDD